MSPVKKIHVTPTLWPWCIYNIIPLPACHWKSFPRCRIPWSRWKRCSNTLKEQKDHSLPMSVWWSLKNQYRVHLNQSFRHTGCQGGCSDWLMPVSYQLCNILHIIPKRVNGRRKKMTKKVTRWTLQKKDLNIKGFEGAWGTAGGAPECIFNDLCAVVLWKPSLKWRVLSEKLCHKIYYLIHFTT